MKPTETIPSDGWGRSSRTDRATTPAARLLWFVDACLCGILCAAPFVFGGRHDLGRLVLVSLIALAATAWFIRQALISIAPWNRSLAHVILLASIGLVALQVAPLPASWIARLAPRNADLMPLWTAGPVAERESVDSGFAQFDPWRTISLTPHETTKSLAMLVAYSLLFVVVAQRINDANDVKRLARCIAFSGVLMAGFGLAQYFTSDGQFFWFFEHPFRKTTSYVTGSFINRNHFASFLVLAVGPLLAWLVESLRSMPSNSRRITRSMLRERSTAIIPAGALALVILAILRSLSRGGAVALLVAAVVIAVIYWYRRLVDGRYAYGLVLLAIAMIGMLSLYGYDDVARRIDDFAEGSIDAMDQDDGRRTIWAANVGAIKAGWLTGSGAGSHREIYHAYLSESHPTEYTHAESGYLQVATETGIAGGVLLLSGITLCGSWCVTSFRNLRAPTDILYFGACAAGLAASAVHSGFDFVWYIPACMSVTIVLAACALRLAQLSRAESSVPLAPQALTVTTSSGGASGTQTELKSTLSGTILPRGRWCELAVAAALVGVWAICTYFGPAMAAIHWDRYLRSSLADHELASQQLDEFVAGEDIATQAMRRKLAETMLYELRQTTAWDPRHAEAHGRLADRLMSCFELEILNSDNIMDIAQVREAALASRFPSTVELHAWLERAFGSAAAYLTEASFHARRSVELSPLCGEGYLYLADLCFLEGASREAVRKYVDQGLAVRPFDNEVLFRAGRHELFLDPAAAILHWSRCFHMPGARQKEIIYRLVASQMPAAEFVEHFQPEWPALREIWIRYRTRGSDADLDTLAEYAADVTTRQIGDEQKIPPEHIWFWQAMLYRDLNQEHELLACLEHAHACNPRLYHVRYALAQSLISAGRFPEAEPHVRWCLARRPTEKSLAAALATIAKQRFAARVAVSPSPARPTSLASPVVHATYQDGGDR